MAGEPQVRIRVWIKETTSDRLDTYMEENPKARVADVVDAALDRYLSEQGF